MAAKNMEEIAAWLKELKFRKKIIGGVDEANVWHNPPSMPRPSVTRRSWMSATLRFAA